MQRRGAVEPVVDTSKASIEWMDRNCLAHRSGDANNAILAATGYNVSLLIK
jgi:transposase, IS5 family